MRTLLLLTLLPSLTHAATITALRCPDSGIQPQAAIDPTGKIHIIYLKGPDSAACDIFYATSTDTGKTWSTPLRVNFHPNSAIATGTVRGPQLSLGKNNRPHIAWMGSASAQPRALNDATPMLYTRLNDTAEAFEPQRNLIAKAPGLDGGGSLAADPRGVVAVTWHAPFPGKKGEENRTVFTRVSLDDGQTFINEEVSMVDPPTGACGCCGMRSLFDDKGNLVTLYRAANESSRDLYLVYGGLSGKRIQTPLQPWPTKTCPMSTASLARVPNDQILMAWETAGQVQFASLNPATDKISPPTTPPGQGKNRKHPSLAANNQNQTLLAWTEGTAWKKGGSLHYQLFDPNNQPLPNNSSSKPDLQPWSLPTTVATKDGNFLILY